MENEKKPNKKLKIIGNAVFFTLISIIVAFSVWNFVDIRSGYKYPIFGMRTSVIVSPSMAGRNDANTYLTDDMKQIQKYDVVTTVQYKSYDDIKLYDVATYFTGSKDLICHRVVGKYIGDNGIKYVIFRGDSNAVDDAPVSYDLVRGKVVSVTPKAGHFVSFVQSPYFFLAIFGCVFFVALGLFIVNLGKEKKQQEAQGQIEEQPAEPVDEAQDSPKEEVPEETPPEEPKEDEKEK